MIKEIQEKATQIQIQGKGTKMGYAFGKLFFPQKSRGNNGIENQYINEYEKYKQLVDKAKENIKNVKLRAEQSAGADEAEIFDVYEMMLDDPDFEDKCIGYIDDGMNVTSAVESAASFFAEQFRKMPDEYLSARADDMKGLASLILGADSDPAFSDIPDECIIVADDLTPAQTVLLDKTKVRGFVTFSGSLTSHTAILSKSLGIPALLKTGKISREYEGLSAIIDSENGVLIISPDLKTYDEYRSRISVRENERIILQSFKNQPTVTKSGRKIMLYANIGSPAETAGAHENGAEGIGLLRSEFLFLDRDTAPDEDEQFDAYRKIAESMHGKRVIIRTLDIGADKKVGFLDLEKEENPALGLRGIRLCFEYPVIFREQLRAILRASAYGNIAIMLPMITSKEQIIAARELIDREKTVLTRRKIAFDPDIKLGIMIETPASAVISDELAEYSDFFSVGTNDLCQYTYAADRQNRYASESIPEYPLAVMRLIRTATKNIHEYPGKWIGICGELAADPGLTQSFLDMGIDELSISSPNILNIRKAVFECN